MSEWVTQELADEAAEQLAAFDLELITWEQVVQWADEWVLQLD